MRILFFSLLVVTASSPLAAQQREWYVITVADAPVGWMYESRATTPDAIRTESAMRIALNRLGSQVVIENSNTATESPTGRLRALDVGLRMSEQEVTTRLVVDGMRATLTTEAGGRSFDRTVPLTDSLIGPDAARRLSLRSLRAVGDSVSYMSWDGQLGAPSRVTRVVVAVDSLRQIVERSSGTTIATTIWMDGAGRTVRSQFDMPFGRTVAVRTDSASALAAGAGGTLSAESYRRTLVRTEIRIPRARETEYLRLALESTDSATLMPDLTGPGQHVVSRAGPRTVVEIVRRRPRMRAAFPVVPTSALREYLEPNAYIQSNDSAVVAQARAIVGTERDLFSAALKLERWVAENLQLDLGIAFAPSSEVFVQRRGTCVAYATMLATLTRAVGIPSRIAMGYVYVNGILGGHAWTEVRVGDEWIPIDAAIVGDGPADAARIAFAWSSLADGPGSLTSGAAAQLYGRLRARIESFDVAGVRRRVPPDARPYVLAGDRYINDWLGIEVIKPAGFRFADLDETWPSRTILAFEKGTERVRLLARPRAPWAAPAVRPNEIINGSEVWVIEVESVDPDSLLRVARGAIRFRR